MVSVHLAGVDLLSVEPTTNLPSVHGSDETDSDAMTLILRARNLCCSPGLSADSIQGPLASVDLLSGERLV